MKSQSNPFFVWTMETTLDHPPPSQTDGPDSSTPTTQLSTHHHDLLAELESLRQSHQQLHSISSILEDNALLLQSQRDEALRHNSALQTALEEAASERDFLRVKVTELEGCLKEKEEFYSRSIEEERSRNWGVEKDLGIYKERIHKLELEVKDANQRNGILLKSLDSLSSVILSLEKILDCIDDKGKEFERVDDSENGSIFDLDVESKVFYEEVALITRLASEAEQKVIDFNEKRMKEKKELESSVVSLTEENRDTNTLLRVALMEKEAVEKSLNKLKGNNDQKRVALLQIAERGLQRVGFGFMMGSGSIETPVESSAVSTSSIAGSSAVSTRSDSSECDEEVVSLASTVEKIMKTLRLEISQLRRALEESRSDAERLQSLTEKQASEIAESIVYIRNLEDSERVLRQNVEELLMEIKETEAEVDRWREACELEVEAGKNELQERDKMIEILKQELEKTKAALEISNGKLKLKEELVAAAVAAQTAAERSLELADSRAAALRERIEELTRQQEEADKIEGRHRKIRHICWPWRVLKASATNGANVRVQRRLMPEMQALLH